MNRKVRQAVTRGRVTMTDREGIAEDHVGEQPHHSVETVEASAAVTIQIGRKFPCRPKFHMLEVVVSTTYPCEKRELVRGNAYREAISLTTRELNALVKEWKEKIEAEGE